MSHTLPPRQKYTHVRAVIATGLLAGTLSWAAHAAAASSWSPTLLVNTEAFQIIDDASSSDLVLKFGATVNKTLTYDRSAQVFRFNDDVYVLGTLSGSTVRADTLLASSGTLAIESNAAIDGSTLTVQADSNRVGVGTAAPETALEVVGIMSGTTVYATKSFSGAGLGAGTDCDGAGSKLLWDAATGRFSCGTDQNTTAWSNTGALKTAFDERYVNVAGDTMTGALVIDVPGGTATALTVSGSLSFGYQVGAIRTIGPETPSFAAPGQGNSLWVFAGSGTSSAQGGNLVLAAGGGGSGGNGGTVTLKGGKGYAVAGDVRIFGGYATDDSGGEVYIHGGYGAFGQGNTVLGHDGTSAIGRVAVGKVSPLATLDVAGTASGITIYASRALASSGTLVFEGAASGSSLYLGNKLEGAGLTDCDNTTNSKLLWDATTGRFSCGTDQSGGGAWSNTGALKTAFDERYVNVAGDTMTGALTIKPANGNTGALLLSTRGGQHILFGSGGRAFDVGLKRISTGSLMLSGSLVISAKGSGASLKEARLAVDGLQIGQLEGGLIFGRTTVHERIWDLTNYGSTWAERGSSASWYDIALSADGKRQTAVVNGGQIYTSNDYGFTWTARDSNRSWYGIAMSADGKVQTAVADNDQIYTSSDYGATWTARDGTRNWWDIAMTADGKIQTAVDSVGQIYTSGNYGVTWIPRDNNHAWREIAMSSDGKIQTALEPFSNIFTSDDYGVTWTARDSSRSWFAIAMNADGKRQTAVVNGGQIYTSNDYGFTWTARDSNRSWYGIAMSTDGKVQSAVVNGGQIYISNDYGITWTATESSRDWRSIAMSADGKVQTGVVDSGFIYVSHATATIPGGLFNVSGTMSGAIVRAQTTLASSGSLVFEGAASGSSLYLGNKLEGAGLTDCDTGATSKLLWDATTGRFSCGTDQTGGGGSNWSNTGALMGAFDNRYVNTAGDTMTGALTIDIGTLNQRGTGTGLILFEKLRMLSGATLSGAIVIKAGPELGKTGSGELRLSVRELAGRELLRARGPNGMGYALQPSLFEKNIMILTPGGGTTVNGFGTTVTNDTTVSHPTPTQTFGYMANFATAATSGDDAGTSSAVTNIFRGSTTGSGGFFTYARLGTLETTSIRLFSGLTDQTIATMVGADNPTGNHIGFQFSTARADTNWQFARKNGTTQTVTDTGLPFRGHNVYDLMMYCSDACTTVFWRIENVTLGTSAEGSVTDNLPTATTALRMVLGVEAQTTSARNIRMQKMYVEADR